MSGKGRKRSISNILDEEETSSSRRSSQRSTAPSRRNRSISIIDEEVTASTNRTSTSRFVRCNCIECNGRMVDSRTKVLHELRDQGSQESAMIVFDEPQLRDQGS